MQNQFTLPSRSKQRLIGLGLAAMIAGSWLTLHFYAMFVFELSAANWLQATVLAVLLCWLSVGVFIVSHDAMHGSLAPGLSRLSATIGAALLFLYAGFGWKKMRSAHFEHHKLSGHDGDPDFDAANPRNVWRWYVTFFMRYFGWKSFAFVSLVVALYKFAFDVPMAQLVLLYGVPAIASSLQLFYYGTYRPHHHAGTGEAFCDRHNARSDRFGGLISLVTCFHFGYHLEHHRRPDVPWWALPAARRFGLGEKVAV
ncbi:MAG: fatty acid desaturase [Erythrobacter sp.]